MTADGPASGRERREKPRFSIRLQVVVVVERLGVRQPYSFVTRNLSETGLFIAGEPHNFSLGPDERYLELTLRLGDEADADLVVVAEIVYRTPTRDGFGLRFVKIAPDAQDRLSAFIADFALKYPGSLE